MQNQRTFFLYKGNVEPNDSRFRASFMARLEITPTQARAQAAEKDSSLDQSREQRQIRLVA